jgi:hypothetical protein
LQSIVYLLLTAHSYTMPTTTPEDEESVTDVYTTDGRDGGDFSLYSMSHQSHLVDAVFSPRNLSYYKNYNNDQDDGELSDLNNDAASYMTENEWLRAQMEAEERNIMKDYNATEQKRCTKSRQQLLNEMEAMENAVVGSSQLSSMAKKQLQSSSSTPMPLTNTKNGDIEDGTSLQPSDNASSIAPIQQQHLSHGMLQRLQLFIARRDAAQNPSDALERDPKITADEMASARTSVDDPPFTTQEASRGPMGRKRPWKPPAVILCGNPLPLTDPKASSTTTLVMNQQDDPHKKCSAGKRLCALLLCIVILVIIVIVATGVPKLISRSSLSAENTNSATNAPTMTSPSAHRPSVLTPTAPTPTMPSIRSNATSLAPTTFTAGTFPPVAAPQFQSNSTSTASTKFNSSSINNIILAVAPWSTINSLKNASSAQSQALAWVQSTYTNTTGKTEEQIAQSFGLATLAYETNSSGWTQRVGWLNSQIDYCSWFGITCNANGLIDTIQLRANKLQGKLPNELSVMNNSLQTLDVGENQLTGGFPIAIGRLTELTTLFFDHNRFSGFLPKSIGALINLKFLHFEWNYFSGSTPIDFGNLTNLTQLYMFDNNLTGSIPAGVCSNTNLVELKLDCHEVSGSCWTSCFYQCGGNTGVPCNSSNSTNGTTILYR